MEKRWLKPNEAAAYLGISRGSLYNAISRGLLPASKTPGVGIRLDRVKLDALLEENESPAINEYV